jgi:hypothetical protein
MMRRSALVVTLSALGVIVVVACGTAGEQQAPTAEPGTTQEVPADLLDQVRNMTKAVGSDFLGKLLQELRAHGPAEALQACSMDAQDLAHAHSMSGARVRRVTLKMRNPADAPDEYERAVLEEWEALHEQDELPTEHAAIVSADGRRTLRYLKPIVVMPPCLSCHGDPAEMEPEVNARLGELYPEDTATGYAVGDLRGAFSVTLELEPEG